MRLLVLVGGIGAALVLCVTALAAVRLNEPAQFRMLAITALVLLFSSIYVGYGSWADAWRGGDVQDGSVPLEENVCRTSSARPVVALENSTSVRSMSAGSQLGNRVSSRVSCAAGSERR